MRWLLMLLLLVSCGGGSGESQSAPPVSDPGPSRPGVYYGYYGSCLTCLAQTVDHVNIIWESPSWNGEQAIVDDMTRARLPTVLMSTPSTDVNALRVLLTKLRNANVLQYVVALYPLDEPDVARWSDAAVRAMVAQHRAVAAEFVELAAVKIAVIYGPGNSRPGIDAFDWVGFDNYDNGNAVLGNELTEFKALLRPDQRLILVPGGANPWHIVPTVFYERVQTDSQVLMLLPFLWSDYPQGRGIGQNGMAETYRKYGAAIKNGK